MYVVEYIITASQRRNDKDFVFAIPGYYKSYILLQNEGKIGV